MVFWGTEIGNKPTVVNIEEGGSIYLLQVCLETASGSGITSLHIQPSSQKKSFVICHLGSGHPPQFSLCHELVADDSPIKFWTTGGRVHVTGTTQVEDGSDYDDDDDDGDEGHGCHGHGGHEEGEEEEEVVDEDTAPPQSIKAEKRSRSIESVKTVEPMKKSKATLSAPPSAVVAADVVIPQTHQQRKKWKIKPQNDEGVLVLVPKSLKKASGVSVTDYIIGKGAEPKLGAKIKITYEGSFPDGTVFDQRITRAKPFSFRMGTAQVIRGLDFGLEGMRIGGSREIIIPPELG